MKYLLFAFLSVLTGLAQAAGPSPVYGATPYCLPSSTTTVSGTFVYTGMVNPTSNAATTIEMTGTDTVTGSLAYFVITMGTGTGFATNLPSCPIKYGTQQ